MDFSNFLIPYVFDVKESVYRGFTRPLFSDELEIQINFRFCRNSKVLTVGSYGFS